MLPPSPNARAIDTGNVYYIFDQAEIYAFQGKPKEAPKALQESLEKNYPAESAAADSDLDSLRSSPEFNELINKYSEKKP
ncbi:MAG: hypothetical protein WBL70_03340 [Candidatus Acidiferrales bacterium]